MDNFMSSFISYLFELNTLTAFVQTALWRAAKKNGLARSQITVARKD